MTTCIYTHPVNFLSIVIYSVKRILIQRSGLHERDLPNAIQKPRIHGQKKG